MAEKLFNLQISLIEKCNKALINSLLDDLRHEKILSDAEVEFITEGKPTTSEKMRKLCNMVLKKGDRASNILLQKLYKRDETLYSSLGIKGPLEEPQSSKGKRGNQEEPQSSKDQTNSVEQDETPPKKKQKKGDCGPRLTLQQMLQNTLKEMENEEFELFKETLKDKEFLKKHQCEPMTTSELEDKKRIQIASLMIRRYTTENVLHVACAILEVIGENELAKNLRPYIDESSN